MEDDEDSISSDWSNKEADLNSINSVEDAGEDEGATGDQICHSRSLVGEDDVGLVGRVREGTSQLNASGTKSADIP